MSFRFSNSGRFPFYLVFISALFIANTARHKLVFYSPGCKDIILFSAIIIFFSGVFFFLLKRTKFNLTRINAYFNLLFFFFLLFEIYKFISYKEFAISLQDKINPEEIKFKNDSVQKRSIYLIVLDSYTSSSSLKKYW